MNPGPSVPGIFRALALFLALGTAGCEGVSVEVTFQTGLWVTPDTPPAGATLTITFSNLGDVPVTPEASRFEFVIRDAKGQEQRRLEDASGVQRLYQGDEVVAFWDQKDASGSPVAAGAYEISTQFRAGGQVRRRSKRVTIG